MDENKPQIFNSEEFGTVRTLETAEGKILFCGTDVAKALGYSNPYDALTRHCKSDGVVKHEGVSKTTNQYGKTTEQIVEMKFITEGNVYRLITHSKLPNAERFESWVFDEVLPSIRKHGSYNADYSSLSPQLQYLISLEQKTKALEQKQTELENKLAESEKNRDEIIKATFEFGRIGELQRNEITKAVKKRAIELCRYAETYDKVGKSVISSIYKGLQKEFKVKSYLDLSYNQYTDCMIFIQYFFPDQKLDLKIMHEQPKPSMKIFEMLTET